MLSFASGVPHISENKSAQYSGAAFADPLLKAPQNGALETTYLWTCNTGCFCENGQLLRSRTSDCTSCVLALVSFKHFCCSASDSALD
jgi:hypothetical protein